MSWIMSAVSVLTSSAAGIALGTLDAELFPTELRGTANALLLIVTVGGSGTGLLLAGHLSDGVSDDVLARAFQYWKNIDQEIGERIEQAVGAVAGLETIQSTSQEGSSNVRLSFAWGTDLSEAMDDLRTRPFRGRRTMETVNGYRAAVRRVAD